MKNTKGPFRSREQISHDVEARRKDILKAIKSMTRHNGYAPTVRELANALHSTPAGIHNDLTHLRAEDRVDWVERTPRTLKVIRPKG